jgi:hypothetical protein
MTRTMNFRWFSQEDLDRLNSATKYPSILTYHALGDKGRLTPELTTEFTGAVQVKEKIDGTNARIIIPPRGDGSPGLIIGSREELLHYTEDLIHNPSQGIVSTLYATFQSGAEPLTVLHPTRITVIYGEVYGGKVTAGSKQYTSTGAAGFRVFDIATIPTDVLDLPRDQIASWRDRGGQEFVDSLELAALVDKTGFQLVPELAVPAPPTGLEETWTWLEASAAKSLAAPDGGAGQCAEGVVVRSIDRSSIAKLRVEDYRRTLRGTR